MTMPGMRTTVASDISNFLQDIAQEQVDAATANYKGLPTLTRQIASSIKGISPSFVYGEIKKS